MKATTSRPRIQIKTRAMPDKTQMPLRWRWPEQQVFEHFVVADNGLALSACRRAASEDGAPWVVLSGPTGCGKSHLLLAACQESSARGRAAQYLSLAELPAQGEQAIRGLGGTHLVAIDDLQALEGHKACQHALFDLYNRLRQDGAALLLAGTSPVAAMQLELADLQSRLAACSQFVLRPLAEDARRNLLRKRAAVRGLELDERVLDWLFRYHARDLASLAQVLEVLDNASLAQRRRVTVPFLRELLVS